MGRFSGFKISMLYRLHNSHFGAQSISSAKQDIINNSCQIASYVNYKTAMRLPSSKPENDDKY